MAARVFLGWDHPFSERVAEWLLARREELPEMLVLVPTGGSGRRLRETLAAAAGGLLAPRVATPGALLRAVDEAPDTAPVWAERVAWTEVLEAVTDWSSYLAVFPEPPGSGTGWAWELAGEMVNLRRSLQDNGLLLADGARHLQWQEEAERWTALAGLEQRVEETLRRWGMVSRSRKLAAGLPLRSLPASIVLAGVADLPPLLAALLREHPATNTLIAAPEAEADAFDDLGLPLASWNERHLPWPALATVGWTAFHPGARPPANGLRAFLRQWRRWLDDPSLAVMADLLALPETAALLPPGACRAELAQRLGELRGAWMCQHSDDLARRLRAEKFRREEEGAAAEAVLAAAEQLGDWRKRLLREPFATAAAALLDQLAVADDGDARAWLAAAGLLTGMVRRPAGFWLDLLLESLPPATPEPPDTRAADVQGWLELLYEPGRHLVICGLNDGKVPTRGGGDPWLGEAARKALGLPGERQRAARDAFLYQAMLETRRHGGRVDLICGKAGGGGEVMLPSRLLLAADRSELPQRVAVLFREVEPPDAGLRRQADWQWAPPALDPPKAINTTALTAYLACPFRYYLSQIAGMNDPETARTEWNQRDFGNITHTVLETWGQDREARELSKTEALEDWLTAELDRVVKLWFGRRVPLAIRIQTAALRQRLGWFARAQAISRAEGWQVVDVERRVEIPAGDAVIVARIDRIDQHAGDQSYRVVDYKTGRVKESVAGAHCVKVIASTRLPAHLGDDSPAVFEAGDEGKQTKYRWKNLQLPLYAAGLVQRGMPLPTPCYFTVGDTEKSVGIEAWQGFSEEVLAAGLRCAKWLVAKIRQGVFWPPAERPRFDDFRDLAAGGSLAEAVRQPWTQV
ncbi:MAG: PD-(D/E)XK nuclease family protein [Akkermansiaceae bacterium]|nr:PD-(D/E)XK nuclease family protein [Akkermansiaceae bacterium]